MCKQQAHWQWRSTLCWLSKCDWAADSWKLSFYFFGNLTLPNSQDSCFPFLTHIWCSNKKYMARVWRPNCNHGRQLKSMIEVSIRQVKVVRKNLYVEMSTGSMLQVQFSSSHLFCVATQKSFRYLKGQGQDGNHPQLLNLLKGINQYALAFSRGNAIRLAPNKHADRTSARGKLCLYLSWHSLSGNTFP